MRILKWELQKIWRPSIIVALILLGMVYYWIRPAFYIDYFCNGPYAQAQYDLSIAWLSEYGTTIEADERMAIGQEREEAIIEFDQQVAVIAEAAVENIASYDDFLAYERTSENSALVWQIIGHTNWFTIQALDDFLAEYDQANSDAYWTRRDLDDSYRQRVEALVNSPAAYGILPDCVRESTNAYAKYLAIWCVLSVIILLSPTLVRDRLHRMCPWQWSSCYGRRILTKQMQAAFLSAIALTLINIAIYAVPFVQKGALIFQDCWLYSLWPRWYPWFDWTYGTYLLVLLGMIGMLSLTAAAATIVLSQYSSNYIAMVLKALPLFVIIGWFFTGTAMEQTAFFGNRFSVWLNLPGAEFVCTIALFLVSLVWCINTCQRQKQREL